MLNLFIYHKSYNYKTIQNNKTIYLVLSKHELIHSNELAQLTGKTDRQVELANHKKVGQFSQSQKGRSDSVQQQVAMVS